MSNSTEETGTEAQMRFSEAVAELESIVKDLESGDLDLEDSIERYERGVALLEVCRSKLENAQQRVTVLMGELEDETAGDPPVASAEESG